MKTIHQKNPFFIILIVSCFICCIQTGAKEKLSVFGLRDSAQQRFGIEKLSQFVDLEQVDRPGNAQVVVITSEALAQSQDLLAEFKAITPEGFSIKRLTDQKMGIIAADQTGGMYGLLELAEQLGMGKTIAKVAEKQVKPKLAFRAIKFNLPWRSYRMHESLQLHDQTCRDLKFWRAFLDQMAENRFNALTLWNLHPFPYMIRTKNFPEACPFTDEELKTWQHFWHSLFRMAKDRGIKTYMINWNIFVTPEFAQAHGVADYCLPEMAGQEYYGPGDYSPIIQQYTRQSMTQLINEYPELTGFGVSQNERMQGVDEQVWQNWIVDTYFDAMDKADRKIEFILRAHTHPAPELTRKAIEDNAHRLGTVYVPVKFNWSHAHATPKLMYIHGGSRSTSLWEPAPKNYKMVFTMRNEDFFVLRWGDPDFVRQVVAENNQDYIGGFMIGSETFIPAKEYITKPGPHLTWQYAFEKQWLFYQVWGRLLYDPATRDEVFAYAFNRKYSIDYGDRLLAAHKLADQMPLKLASYYAASWDFTLYSEGFLAGYVSNMGCFYDKVSPFISVDEIIGAVTLDNRLVSVKDFVAGKGTDKISPLQVADELEENGHKALAIVQEIKTDNPTLRHEIADIKAWSLLSLYFSEKLRGATTLQFYRVTGEVDRRAESIRYLESALDYWEKLVTVTSLYIDDIPLLHLGDKFNNGGNSRPLARFSWANLMDEVRYDIEIAETSTPAKKQ